MKKMNRKKITKPLPNKTQVRKIKLMKQINKKINQRKK